MPPVTQVSHMYEGPIMRSRAKLLQKEVNSLLAEINFNIFENIILPKRSTLVLGIQMKRRMLLYIGQALRKMDRQFKLAQ
jgi:hypothetical protein